MGIESFFVYLLMSSSIDKAAFAQKTQKLQMPFIANKGQVDEQVRFYAKTFGGTVFVTKDGEIVYALPNNRSDVETQCLASLVHSPKGIRDKVGMLHDYHVSDIMHPASWIVDHDKSEFQNPKSTSSDSKNLKSANPKSAIQNLKSGVTMKETLIGGRVQEITGNEKAVTKVSYFKGNDKSQWKTNISAYYVVSLGEIYDGIELKLKAYGNNVEKLFCIKPDANPEQIKISLSGIQPSGNPPPLSPSVRGTGGCPPLAGAGGGLGARGLWVNEYGELVAETELGPVKFTKPVAYQEINGKRVDVSVEYKIQKSELNPKSTIQNLSSTQTYPRLREGIGDPKSAIKNVEAEVSNPKSKIANRKLEYGFTVASYDRTKDLIIDPLLASTYLGGSSNIDVGYSLALDTSGNVYVTGYTGSTDFPTTNGAYNTSYGVGYFSETVFVSKLDGGLTSLLASTFLGGYDDDKGYSLTLDTSAGVYVTGNTRSTFFPTTIGAYDTSFNGGVYSRGDVFVSKLDGNLIASTATPTPTPTPSPTPSPSPTPTPSGCDGVTKTVETDTGDFELLKQESKVVTVTVTDAGGCPVADKKVFARINRAGKKRIKISSSIETTDENGATAFTITAKKKTVKATVTFKSGGIKKKITVTVVSE